MRTLRIAAAASLLSGCLSYQSTSGVEAELFRPLHERRLPAFAQQIDVREQAGEPDGWTRVASAWLALANCEEIPPTSEQQFAEDERVPRFLHASLRAEDQRRRMLVGRAVATREKVGDTSFRYLHAPGWFTRDATDVDPSLIRWPAEPEDWVDEVPVPEDVESSCSTFAAEVLAEDDEGNVPTYSELVDRYLGAAAAAERAYGALDQTERTGALAVLAWRIQFYVVQVNDRLAAEWRRFGQEAAEAARVGAQTETARDRADHALARGEGYAATAREKLAVLVDRPPAELPPSEAGRARLLFATYLLDAGKTALALSMLASVRDTNLDEESFWTARYLELRVSSDAARWNDAAKLADAIPPPSFAVHPAYVYRAGVALARTGRDDQFLQLAMKAFRDRPYQSDPFLRALYVQMLEKLAEYPFEPRIIEMLEDLGPRAETYERVEEYARTALDRGRTENADAAAQWLLARNSNARFHPRYHAIRALAAFLEDDPPLFRQHVDRLVARPEKVLEAVPAARRSTFFAAADGELARILRQMLPVMAEWGDDRPAQERRERWLKIIVARAQTFLRETTDSLARPQLTELYRLASGLLQEHPRGYAERVGQEAPAPLVLGTVRVQRGDLDRWEPTLGVDLPEPFSLTLLPDPELSADRWPFFWDVEEDS